MTHARLSLFVRWVACWVSLLASAQPRGTTPDGFPQLTESQAVQALNDFRHSRLANDLCLKFEIIHKPRRGENSVAIPGTLWAGWTKEGSRVRVEIRDAASQITLAFIATKSGTTSQLWLSRHGQLAREVTEADSRLPLASGLLLTAADLYLPFTHWPVTRYSKTERARGRPVHFFDATNPAKDGPSSVTFGIDRAYGALVQATTKNAQGEAIRTLQVEELAKADEQWLLGSCSIRDEVTRDRDVLKFTEAAVRATINEAAFDPPTLTQPASLPVGTFKPL